jgi:hypothetical protein
MLDREEKPMGDAELRWQRKAPEAIAAEAVKRISGFGEVSAVLLFDIILAPLKVERQALEAAEAKVLDQQELLDFVEERVRAALASEKSAG